jgi:hypothetical protein
MQVLRWVLCAIGTIAVGTLVLVCLAVVFDSASLIKPLVLFAWRVLWRLGVLAIALFILMTLVESLRS